MFRVVFHPSSGAHNSVSTVSGINETVTVTCHGRGCTGRSATSATGNSNGLINVRYCRYSVMNSWWWMKYHPKHVEQLTGLNKLYSVASCWIIIAILHDVRSIEHKKNGYMCDTMKEINMTYVSVLWLYFLSILISPRLKVKYFVPVFM